MNTRLRRIAALRAGCVTAVVIALTGTFVARTLWPDYAAAEPEKAYNLAMLVARLAVGVLCTAGAASRLAEAGAKLLAEFGLDGQVRQLAPDYEGVVTSP